MRSRKTEFEPKEVWQDVLLGDDRYFQLATGGTPSTERQEYWEEGTVPWLSSGEVHKKIIRFADGRITEEGFHHSNARFYPTHSILIALAGQGKTRGTAAITEIEVTSNQSIAAVIPNKELVEPYFVYYYLDSLYQELRSISAGAGRAGLNLSILAKVPIRLPNKPIQERIAAVLLCIDRGIEHTKAVIAKQRQIKTGLTHDLLTKGIDENGNIRSETTHEFKDSALGRIPKDWDVDRLENFAVLQRGFDLPVQNRKEGHVPVYGSNGVNGYHNISMIKAPGVVTGRSGSIGNIFVVDVDFWPLNTTLYVRDFHDNHPKFVALVLEYLGLERFAAATGVPSLNRNFVHPIPVRVPQPEEQEGILEHVDAVLASERNQRRSLTKLKSIKQGLMQDLLTGEVSVESLLAETTSVSA